MPSRPALDREALQATIGSAWQVEVVESTASTNADLLAAADAADGSDGTDVPEASSAERRVLVAEVQTAGRGRLDRAWSSPPRAGLTFSVLVRPVAPASTWGWLPLLSGLALQEAVSAHTPCTLKWPNDLLDPDGGKLAGILAQSSGTAVVVGIGLNVTTQRAELPVPTASSLALRGATPDRADLLASILTRFGDRYDSWSAAGGDAVACGLAAAYRARCATLGSDVTVDTPAGRVAGRAVDVDPGARLVLDVGGTRQLVAAGDVTHLRPAT